MRAQPLLLLLLAAPVAAAAQAPDDTPNAAELSDSSLAMGKALFHGAGNCSTCHGEAGRGSDRGANLTDGVWRHGNGGFLSIVERVVHGVDHPTGGPTTPMPRLTVGQLSYRQARSVAAYVWTLSHAIPASLRPSPSPSRPRTR